MFVVRRTVLRQNPLSIRGYYGMDVRTKIRFGILREDGFLHFSAKNGDSAFILIVLDPQAYRVGGRASFSLFARIAGGN